MPPSLRLALHPSNDNVTTVRTKSCLPTLLPTEIWLQILEDETILNRRQLWCISRHVSRLFKDCVERIFVTKHLPDLRISLALPRHNPVTGALKWPGRPIPRASMILSFDQVNDERGSVVHRSPAELLDGSTPVSIAMLRDSQVLTKYRLQEATSWLYFSKNMLTGIYMEVKGDISWNAEDEVWTWEMDWRTTLTQFFRQKEQSNSRQNEVQKRIGRQRRA